MSLFSGLEFREPLWLSLLLLAPLLYFLATRSTGAVTFSSLRLLPAGDQGKSLKLRFAWLPAALLTFAFALLAVSASGPRVGNKDTKIEKQGIAIMMVVDTSGSMRALDLSTSKSKEETRLDVVKKLFESFVLGDGELPGRGNDSIGIVRFAGHADTSCPLTLDHGSLAGVARTLEIVTDRSEDGTAIGDGLALAVGRIKESPARSKIIILLTDGVNNAGTESPTAAAELAKVEGVKVYTIGAGTNGMAPVRVPDPFSGGTRLQAMPVQIDEDTLKEIANRTQGKYFRATNYKSLRRIYNAIDKLERTKLDQVQFRQYHEYYLLTLALALLLISLAVIADATYFRRTP